MADEAHLVWIALVAAHRLLQHGGNVGGIVLTIAVEYHQPVATPVAHPAQHRHALAHGMDMAQHLQPGETRLQIAQYHMAVVHTAIVHIDQFVLEPAPKGGIYFADKRGQIVPLILGRHHDRDIDRFDHMHILPSSEALSIHPADPTTLHRWPG